MQTIEHLMAALHGCGISNCQIALTGSPELPFLDGSAQSWVELIQNAGIVDLKSRENYIDYHECFEFHIGDSIYRYAPSNDFSIECVIHFPKSIIGYQRYLYYHSYANFIEEIAPCRTFLKETAIGEPFEPQQVMQRLRGIDMATIYNKLIVCNKRSYLTVLRAENEPVKHKILDFIGDIKNIGFAIKGKFYLYKPSHKGNIAFMNELLRRFIKTSMRGIA